MGYVLLCSKEKQHVNSVLFEPWLCLRTRRSRSLPHCQASGLFRHGMWCMNESIHCLSLLMLLLSLGALILCCHPLPRLEEEAASVLIPLYSSSLAKQKARFKARFSAESTNLKQTTISHNKVLCISNLPNYL